MRSKRFALLAATWNLQVPAKSACPEGVAPVVSDRRLLFRGGHAYCSWVNDGGSPRRRGDIAARHVPR
jgi:hypothetical protein